VFALAKVRQVLYRLQTRLHKWHHQNFQNNPEATKTIKLHSMSVFKKQQKCVKTESVESRSHRANSRFQITMLGLNDLILSM
jgi:hypothetical protein